MTRVSTLGDGMIRTKGKLLWKPGHAELKRLGETIDLVTIPEKNKET